MEKFLKDNILYLFIVVLVFGAGVYFTYNSAMQMIDFSSEYRSKQEELKAQQEKLNLIKAQKERNIKQEKRKSENAKVIYEVLGQQFSPEASFGIMFESILSHITNSGLKVRSIDYNYSPADDKILQTNAPEYNACELSFVTVGSYSQLQNFLKNIAKETYLTGINEIYLEPYYKDKTILIARFKIRLYTKTV